MTISFPLSIGCIHCLFAPLHQRDRYHHRVLFYVPQGLSGSLYTSQSLGSVLGRVHKRHHSWWRSQKAGLWHQEVPVTNQRHLRASQRNCLATVSPPVGCLSSHTMTTLTHVLVFVPLIPMARLTNPPYLSQILLNLQPSHPSLARLCQQKRSCPSSGLKYSWMHATSYHYKKASLILLGVSFLLCISLLRFTKPS